MTTGNDEWVERIACAADLQARADVYDEWAARYDSDMLDIGYMNHAIAAALIARHVSLPGARLLDAGVGTGALGEILRVVGYTDLIGVDMSDGMLARARERRIYRELHKCRLGEPLNLADNSFTASVAFGVFAMGHAPPEALDELVRVTCPGGHLIFSVGTIPWDVGGFKEKAAALESARRWSRVDVIDAYHPMPLSSTRSHFTNRACVYRVA